MSQIGKNSPTATRKSARRHLASPLSVDWNALSRRWKLVKQLHQGETARVYAARPVLSSPHRPVQHVVKLLRRRAERNRDCISALLREAHVAANVQHPGLISLVESHLGRAPYYVVFPRVIGTSLADQLSIQGRLPIPLALGLVRQVAESLAALHQAGWLHGDLKPANILVNPAGETTLIDLAFARRIGPLQIKKHDIEKHDHVEPLAGSLNYLPPEALVEGLEPSPAADIYSLGATLYELLTGTAPFAESKTAQQLLWKHRTERPTDVRELRPQIPASVASLVASMLAKQPLRRPQSAHELTESLVRCEIETFGQRENLAG